MSATMPMAPSKPAVLSLSSVFGRRWQREADENQQKIQEGDHPGIADLVEYGRQFDRYAFRVGETCKHARHPKQEQPRHRQFPSRRRNPPQVPGDIARQRENKSKYGEESGTHGYFRTFQVTSSAVPSEDTTLKVVSPEPMATSLNFQMTPVGSPEAASSATFSPSR